MAWNEPENNDRDKNGWDTGPRNGRDQGPPELDQLISDFFSKLSRLFGGKGKRSGGFGSPPENSGGSLTGITLAILVIAAVTWIGLGFYTVDESERGVVLRFGRALDGVAPPGLRWNPPLIDEVHLVNILAVRTQSFSNPMLTEDDNIVDVSMSVQYQATDARAYFLNVLDPETSLQHAAESAIRHEIGSSQMQPAMNEARELIAQNVISRLQSYMDLYKTGITVNQVNIDRSQPPDPVRDAYDDVIKAGEDREAYQNEATAYANQVVPEARGQARRVLEEANGYRDQVIAQAEGEASRFEQLLVEYQKAPAVTRERLYLETLQQIMTSSSKILVDVDGGNNMFYVPLDKILEGRNAPDLGSNLGNLSANEVRLLTDQILMEINSRQASTSSTRGGTR